ncbi:hypothetical protein LCGC14_0417700 [marine sediment metagenome]|uniref:Uncharacterized protein n=1 Tax=marine sediment metagenome TaxID=412755 RepID=A0A0F9SXN2_9ZZZZ
MNEADRKLIKFLEKPWVRAIVKWEAPFWLILLGILIWFAYKGVTCGC